MFVVPSWFILFGVFGDYTLQTKAPTMTDAFWQLGGWTMVHFLWLGTAVALLGAALRFACRRAAPSMRYAMSLVTLTALSALPIAIAAWLACNAESTAHLQPRALPGGSLTAGHELASTPGQSPGLQTAPPLVIDLALTPIESLPQRITQRPKDNPPASPYLYGGGLQTAKFVAKLPWLWLIGAPLTFALLASGLVGSERLRRKCTALTDGPAAAACEQLRQAMRITRQVSIAVCDHIAQPVLIGILRPLILLPASALSGWTPEELEMVLVHELAHVRRWDNLVNLLQRIVESALFFHPAVWLISRQVRRDREECCDAVVVSPIERPHDYAALLVSIAAKLQARRPAALAAASAMADHPLAGRVRRILKLEDEPMWISRRTLGLTLILPLMLIAAVIYSGAAADENPPPSKGGARGGIEDPNPLSDLQKLQADVSSPTYQSEVHKKLLQSLIASTEKKLADLEVFRKISRDSGNPMGGTIERAIADALESDPYIVEAQQTLAKLQEKVAQQQKRTRNPNDPELKAITAKYHDAERQFIRYRSSLEKTVRNQVKEILTKDELHPHDSAYQYQLDSLTKSLERYRARLAVLNGTEKRPAQDLSDAEVAMLFVKSKTDAPATFTYEIDPGVRPQVEQRLTYILDTIRKHKGDAEVVFSWQLSDKQLEVTAPATAQRFVLLEEEPERLPTGIKLSNKAFQPIKPDAPFSSLEDQRVADLAYKLLGIDIEPINADELARVKELGYEGGLRITGVGQSRANFSGMTDNDILVGLHVWPTPDLKSLDAILTRNDLAELSPLKYRVVRQRPDEFDVSRDGKPELVTGRISAKQDSKRSNSPVASLPDAAAVDRPLQPGDRVMIQVVGAFPEHPIHGVFSLEPAGTIALGAMYGRVEIAGQTLLEAEAAVTKHLAKILSDAAVQVTLAATAEAPPADRPLQPDDSVMIEVIGAFPEQPIDNVYAIEPAGTVALGPTYGRVQIAGQTILEAQAGVEKHLAATLTDAKVQLTLHQPAATEPQPPSDGNAIYLYDGKPFDEWRNLWQHELKTERRIEAINALAAFGRAGKATEAAEAILDVAGEYDFRETNTKTPEGRLHEAVRDALRKMPTNQWLPSLVARGGDAGETATRDNYRQLLTVLLPWIDRFDPKSLEIIVSLAKSPERELREAAVAKLLQADSTLEKPETLHLVRAALTGEQPSTMILHQLGFRHLDKVPEQMDLLFHANPRVQMQVRQLLASPHAVTFQPEVLNPIVTVMQRLLPILNDPERPNDRVAAIRAIAAGAQLYSQGELAQQKHQVIERLQTILREGDDELLAPALVALSRLTASDAGLVIVNAKLPEARAKQLEEVAKNLRSEEAQITPVFGGGMGGGGMGGGGGGGFF